MQDDGINDLIPSADEYLERVFGDGGYLAQRFSSYRRREGQVALARAFDEAIAFREHVFAEGGTGIGKSFAYLVPATYYAATKGKQVVVVTANIALTEQLVNKDLPTLEEILPWSFSYGLLKGRGNYLCLDHLDDLLLHRE